MTADAEFPSDAPVRARDGLDVARLAAYLRADSRTRPVAVLTVAANRTTPFVQVDEVARAAAGRADVVLLPTEELTRAFEDSIGAEASVFGGACRVYPPGRQWETKLWLAPVRVARTPDQVAQLPALLLADLETATSPPARPAPPAQPAPSEDAAPAKDQFMIQTETDAHLLARRLTSPARRRPAVVVSRAAGAGQAGADVDELRRDLSGLADVYEITTLAASWAFSRAMPAGTQVYGGAGRTYPAGDQWTLDPYLAPLRFAYGMRGRRRLTRQLVSDTMSMAGGGGSYATSLPAAGRLVTGTVVGTAAGRGIVKLDSGGMAVLWPELVGVDLPADRLFEPDMKVEGDLDPASRRVDVRRMRQDPAQAVGAYRPGDTILVRVAQVEPSMCTVELFPGLTVDIPVHDIADSPQADLCGLMSVGETLPALLVDRDGGEWLLSLQEAGDATDALPAPAILAGGPGWLVPSPPARTDDNDNEDEDEDEGDGLCGPPPDDTADGDVVRELRLENEQMAGLLADATRRADELENQLAMAKTQRREGMRRSRADRKANEQRQTEADKSLFADEADQLDFEIRLAWARKIPAGDKTSWPLRRWTYGERFFQTLRATQGVSRDKIVEVLVDVLTGMDAQLASRELHQLRTGSGGDDPVRVRAGGETCWRVSIQTGTPAARRLHYWKCNDGSIELASIRQHDDFDT